MKSKILKHQSKTVVSFFLVVISCIILITVYLFQRINFLGYILPRVDNANVLFIVNRTLRLVLNDVACLMLIYVFFKELKYLQLAFKVFMFELLVILPLYLAIKLALEGPSEMSSPLLSQIHRLIVNPTLMILLISGFFYQQFLANEQQK